MDHASRPVASSVAGAATKSTAIAKEPTAPKEATTRPTTKLVFGLSSRTNRVKHDEYAESRRKLDAKDEHQRRLKVERKGVQDKEIQQQVNGSAKATDERVSLVEQSATKSKTATATTTREERLKSTIRASKYGNFYKPQDLTQPINQPVAQVESQSNQVADRKVAPVIKSNTAIEGGNNNISYKEDNKSNMKPQVADDEQNVVDATNSKQQLIGATGDQKQKRVRSTSKSPVRRESIDNGTNGVNNGKVGQVSDQPPAAQVVRRKSISGKSPAGAGSTAHQEDEKEKEKEQKPRMHFNTPPPPPQKTAGASKGSVVSYAKSRIYDRPTNKFGSSAQGNNLQHSISPSGSSLELTNVGDRYNQQSIPKSILSGFKPPKQINVSKAREKWEGGEPFARCKSRQRLAAQAGKKLLHGTWSMTSVVATQQLHLQQALAASSPQLNATNYMAADPSVKVLTRGSVLERIQQYERAPSATIGSSLPGSSGSSAGSGSGSGSSTPSASDSWDSTSTTSSSSSSQSDYGDRESVSVCESLNLSLIARHSSSSQDQDQNSNQVASPATSPISPTASRQAQYKLKLLNQQQEQGKSSRDIITNLLLSNNGQATQSPPNSPLAGSGVYTDGFFSSSSSPFGQQRRSSLRRRSSVTSNSGHQSTQSNIPKFYHPNGKPNTYEIELKKKNIVACFEKFPDRQASLTGPNNRRHFHSIALACGFSEYFKEPLCLYIKHQLQNSNLLHNTAANSSVLSRVSRKQSVVAGASPFVLADLSNKLQAGRRSSVTNEQQQAQQQQQQQQQPQGRRPSLTRAASIDTSTMEKLSNQNFVTCDQFLICWLNMINYAYDEHAQFVHLLTLGKRQYLVADDFVPLVQSIIDDHPGLKFLGAAPDFHLRYIQTVVARIFFCLNKSWTGKLSLKELRQGNLLAVLRVLSQEEDINQITDYFSYEHFYVIYCKFWNLDQDHDLLISKEDLAKHNDASISSRVIDRIFSGVVSRQVVKTGKMSYTDFVWFLIAEEDKKHPRSIEYWFRVLDIDGDGFISMYEMEYFYSEQIRRLELMNIEALPFLDSACQILDLVNPKEKNKISLSDLKRTKMATIFFDTFINLEKYLEHESREFVSTRDVVQDGVVISDWDRYASEEYENLVSEESSV